MIRILCHGPLDWTLGSEYLLLALRTLLDQNIEASLCLAGEGPERERILYTIDDLDLHRAAVLADSSANPSALYSEANVFALVALDERDRREYREAMVAGLPIVWAEHTHAQHQSSHDLAGIAVARRDPEALARTIAKLAPSLAAGTQPVAAEQGHSP